jgi:hypothetical protein
MGSRLAAIALAMLVLGALARPAVAQQARTEPQEGDLLWTFAREDPFFDQRVRLAFVLLVDTQPWLEAAPSGLWPAVQLLAADEDDREFARMVGSEAEAGKLLLASGQDFASIAVVGDCRVWVAPPPVEGTGPTAAERGDAGIALGAAFREAIEGLGADVGHCALTSDPATAQLLVWGVGEKAPANPLRDASTLFAPPDLPGRQPGAGTGGGPAVPSTGNAGIERTGSTTSAADVLLLLALAAVLPLAARAATSRAGR